mgnify:FL=1
MTLRQRLLLVAGWIAAALGAGLIASGAVAVAGGQVIDRPLRPMTAAEVAALPVVEVGVPEDLEPQASGGIVSTTGAPSSGRDVAEGHEDPASTGGSTAIPRDEQTEPAVVTGVSVATTEGGQASFVIADGALLLLWLTPQPGYVATTRQRTADSVTVGFSSVEEGWLIEATVEAGEVTIYTRPEPVA